MTVESDSGDPPTRAPSAGAAVVRSMRMAPILALIPALLLLSPPAARAQADFQIVWVIIGEAATADGTRPVRAGRQLFLASDLLSLSLDSVKVSRVDVQPTVLEIAVGEQMCLSALNMHAFGPDQRQVDGAPLSIAIRQDHKERLGLNRSKRDICVKPVGSGEYPVRLTSLLPAPDGTMRGAQIFLRAKGPSPPAAQDVATSRLQSQLAPSYRRQL